VWTELRTRANRADVELEADQLGFDTIASVTRATLVGRVLNLALATRVVDAAIEHGLETVAQIRMPTHLEAGTAQDFLREWPVTFVLRGDMRGMKRVLDLATDPARPLPIAETTTLAQPGRTREGARTGLVEMNITLSSVLVLPDVPLGLETEESR
jgi:hypothetical protein